MSFYADVYVTGVHCRNPESISGPDLFALSGAVVTDSDAQGFVMPVQRLRRDERATFGAYRHVFSGFSDDGQLGFSLRGQDLDNNREWVENRDDIVAVGEKIADGAKQLPVFGDVAGTILKVLVKVIPEVVDQFVEWDEHDELLNHKQVVMLPGAAPLTRTSLPLEVRFRRTDSTEYSDWDYSLYFNVVSQFIPEGFGERGETTPEPFQGSEVSDWTGAWHSAHVECFVEESAGRSGMLDVHVTETSNGERTATTTEGVAIARVYLESATPTLDEGEPTVSGRARRVDEDEGFARIVVERASGRSATLETIFGSLSGASPTVEGVGGRASGGGRNSSTTVEGRAAEPSRREEIVSAPPSRQQSGADFLELKNNAMLEIYRVVERGRPTGEIRLRYARPVTSVLARAAGVVDELLTVRVV